MGYIQAHYITKTARGIQPDFHVTHFQFFLGLVVSQLDILAALENCVQVFTAFSGGVGMEI